MLAFVQQFFASFACRDVKLERGTGLFQPMRALANQFLDFVVLPALFHGPQRGSRCRSALTLGGHSIPYMMISYSVAKRRGAVLMLKKTQYA